MLRTPAPLTGALGVIRTAMFFRALMAFVALPGVFAFLVPTFIASQSTFEFSLAGAIVFGIGLVTLLWCVVTFCINGKGTLAPWSPPRRLVTVGLYRFSRNPMYVGVLLVLAGWAILFQSLVLVCYMGVIAVAFHLRVVLGEEPWLAKTHGAEWQRYEESVPRWLWPSSRRTSPK